MEQTLSALGIDGWNAVAQVFNFVIVISWVLVGPGLVARDAHGRGMGWGRSIAWGVASFTFFPVGLIAYFWIGRPVEGHLPNDKLTSA